MKFGICAVCQRFDQTSCYPDFITEQWTWLPLGQAHGLSLTFATLPGLSQVRFLPSKWLFATCLGTSPWRRSSMSHINLFFLQRAGAECPLYIKFWNSRDWKAIKYRSDGVGGQTNNYKEWFISNNWRSLTKWSLERNVFGNWLGCYACRWFTLWAV